MTLPYRFKFYRTIMNLGGKPFDSTVEAIEIHAAKTPERALRAALHRFVRRNQLMPWDCLATGYECLDQARSDPI